MVIGTEKWGRAEEDGEGERSIQMPQYCGCQYQLQTMYFCMQSIPLRKVRSAFEGRDFLGEDKDHYSEAADYPQNEFNDISRINLEGLPKTIRECLEELNSLDGRNPLDRSDNGPYSQPKQGRDLLKVIQEARQHQELKIYSAPADPECPAPRSPKKCKLIKKLSRKTSKKLDNGSDFEKSVQNVFEFPSALRLEMEAPPPRDLLQIEDTQPSSVQSLWEEECNNTDYLLGIVRLML